jgi:hypothetical protein
MLGLTGIVAGALLVGTVCSGADPATLAMLAANVPLAGGFWAMRQQAKDRLETVRYQETRNWERVHAGWSLEPGEKVPPGYTPPVKKETEPFKLRADWKTFKPGAKPYSPQ